MKAKKYIRAVVINKREFREAVQENKSLIIGAYNEDEILRGIGRRIKKRINELGIKSIYNLPSIVEYQLAVHNDNIYKLSIADITCKNNVLIVHLYFNGIFIKII